MQPVRPLPAVERSRLPNMQPVRPLPPVERSRFAIIYWLFSAILSLTFLATGITIGVATGSKNKVNKYGRENLFMLAWFGCWTFVVFGWYHLHGKRYIRNMHLPEVDLEAEEAREIRVKAREEYWSTIKVIFDFFVGAILVFGGAIHPWSPDGLRHGWYLIVAGSLGSAISSLFGLLFVRSVSSGYATLTTTANQALIFFLSGHLFFFSGLVIVFYIFTVVAFLYYSYATSRRLEVIKMVSHGIFLSVSCLGIGFIYTVVGLKYLVHAPAPSPSAA